MHDEGLLARRLRDGHAARVDERIDFRQAARGEVPLRLGGTVDGACHRGERRQPGLEDVKFPLAQSEGGRALFACAQLVVDADVARLADPAVRFEHRLGA